MSQTIFFPVPGNPELQTRIGQLGRATGSATMERLCLGITGFQLKPLPPANDLLPLPQLLESLRAKEEEVI